MYSAVIIEGRRDAYSPVQVGKTMTVGELIERLKDFDEDTLVFIGNDRQSYGFYTYGKITVDTEELADFPEHPIYNDWKCEYEEDEAFIDIDDDYEEDDEEKEVLDKWYKK